MDTLSSKVEHITSSLYSYILPWAPKLHFPLKNNNNQKQHRNGYCVYGLQTIVDSEERKPAQTILHCYNMAAVTPKPFSPPPPPRRQWKSLLSPPLSPVLQSTVMGDVIGTESGDYMISDVAEEEAVKTKAEGQSQSQQSRGRSEKRSTSTTTTTTTTRQFRPPITRTMAWTFKREYSDDGGLIIRAERSVRRHGSYAVEAHRENGGRLAMEAHSTDYYCEECGWPIDEDQGLDLESVESSVDDDEEEEGGFEFEEEKLANEGCNLLQNESGGYSRDLRYCVSFSYAGGLVRDSDSFNAYLGRPGSAPLQPMTPVM